MLLDPMHTYSKLFPTLLVLSQRDVQQGTMLMLSFPLNEQHIQRLDNLKDKLRFATQTGKELKEVIPVNFKLLQAASRKSQAVD